MKIRLDQIGDHSFAWQETFDVTPQELEHSDVLEFGPVECRGTINVTSSGLALLAKLDYRQDLACVRCLDNITEEKHARLDYLIVFGNEDSRGVSQTDEIELSEEDLGVLKLKHPTLETRPLVLEQIQLGIPMKPLCREDCAGLCVKCGANLNNGSCECAADVDPRWAALGALKKLGDADGG